MNQKSVSELTDREIIKECQAIVKWFDDQCDPSPEDVRPGAFSSHWDWATMNALFPDRCQRFRELKAEYLKRHPAAAATVEALPCAEDEKSERRKLAEKWTGHTCKLDGVPARIAGRTLQFASVYTTEGQDRCISFSWHAVDRVMNADKEFKT